jgi:hypothetical protein
MNLAADAAPAGGAVLLCLFDAGQRPSRHLVGQLNQLATELSGKHVAVLAVQAAAIEDGTFNEWMSNSPVAFPVGRPAADATKAKWAAPSLPWLILADASHRVIAEGFSLEELPEQIQMLPK